MLLGNEQGDIIFTLQDFQMTTAYPYTDPWTIASGTVLAVSLAYLLARRVFCTR